MHSQLLGAMVGFAHAETKMLCYLVIRYSCKGCSVVQSQLHSQVPGAFTHFHCNAGCLHCVALAGCAWCESTCTCKSIALDSQLTSDQCPANSLGLLPWTNTPSQCPSAAPQTGSAQCDPASGYRAIAKIQVTGKQQLVLNASQSSSITLCSNINCGNHGSCTGSGLDASCVCSDGWQGTACDVPPDPCFSHQQACGSGICLPQSSTAAMCLCANGSLAATCSDAALIR